VLREDAGAPAPILNTSSGKSEMDWGHWASNGSKCTADKRKVILYRELRNSRFSESALFKRSLVSVFWWCEIYDLGWGLCHIQYVAFNKHL